MLQAWLGSCRTEVVVRVDGRSHLLPVRQIADSLVYESFSVPHWFSELWRTEKAMMKCLDFTMHKTKFGWRVRWRNRWNEPATYNPLVGLDEPRGCGNTTAESDYHAWLNSA